MINEFKGDTAVQRLCFAPDALSAGARCVSLRPDYSRLWRGLGHKNQERPTRRAPLRGYVLVDYSSSSSSSSSSQSHCELQNIKTGRLYVAHSAGLFAARPEAVSVGSDAWALRAVQRTRRVSSRRQTTTTVVLVSAFCSRNSARTIHPIFPHSKTVSTSLLTAQLKMRSGQNLKLRI